MKCIPPFLQHTALVTLLFLHLVGLAVLCFSVSAANFASLYFKKNATIGIVLWLNFSYRSQCSGKSVVFFLPVFSNSKHTAAVSVTPYIPF